LEARNSAARPWSGSRLSSWSPRGAVTAAKEGYERWKAGSMPFTGIPLLFAIGTVAGLFEIQVMMEVVRCA